MNAVEIIEKKRDGKELTREEIKYFIDGFTSGEILDYQATALCMAIYFQGMTRRETSDITMAMAESGEILDLSDTLGYVVDKHSSGGVGDKTSLVVLPLVVACGVPVAKMSGRGLSFTGGTLDKLESIDGYNTKLTREQFLSQAKEYDIVLTGQTADLAPADGKLYALRDVSGTVPSEPLIAASIMSKKIAGGADGIVLDVKMGLGAFMQTVEDARELAQIMINIGRDAGRQVTALVSDMNQPLGYAVGNAVEVVEAIDALHGRGAQDLIDHCIVVAGHMLRLAGKGKATDLSDVRPMLEEKLANGEAWEMFRKLIEVQGGNVKQVDNPDLLPKAPVIAEVESPQSGSIKMIHAKEIGLTALNLGAGRHKKTDPVDYAVGIVLDRKVGDRVKKGDRLCTIHARTEEDARIAEKRVLGACAWSDEDVKPLPLFYDALFSE
ncbi:MAG: thymidine phosphorylase [Anaerolineae bacterium]|nr:thymidine phosphorylase [Anaerolineae bacterium]